MFQDPQRVVVYRSKAEQMSDDFWWSPGCATPTKAGDGILLAILGSIAVVTFIVLYSYYWKSPYGPVRLSLSKLIWAHIGFFISTPLFFWLLYHFLMH